MIQIQGYRIGRAIAKGGTSEVYEGLRNSDGAKVAIKILDERFSQDHQLKQRLLREAQIVGGLSHVNLVRIFHFGTTGNRIYMVQEYLGGGSLENSERFDKRFLLKTLIQLCDGIRFIHSKGIIHRDLKPANILFGDDQIPRLVDFGISLFNNTDFTRLTQTHLVMGTLAYMAPEQQTNPLSVDHRADIYSLGIMMYELFLGCKPVGRFKDPKEIDPHFDSDFDLLILKCLESSPDQRYPSVAQLQKELIRLWERGLFLKTSTPGADPARTLGAFDERIGVWLRLWQTGSSMKKLEAKQALFDLVDAESDLPLLIKMASEADEQTKLILIPLIAHHADQRALDLLLEHLPNPLFTREVCHGLNRIGNERCVPQLLKLIKIKSKFSDAALAPLARLGEEKHLKAILPFLQSTHQSDRLAAIQALKIPKAKKFVRLMEKLAKKEPSAEVRNAYQHTIQWLHFQN
jgi:serine/threonine protein kinase